ncbi:MULTISPECIES: dihydroneopterin aldolase family protein [unclassified Haladaptatus]|uniref:dihydroneopterin aldolase family protein n=1 Tax=unclassified Haladaptatus TaxID=2622732 RepID=UPI0023E755A9|nr:MULTISPECIES: dihydroneopterin aldolase family protein [unclassified Haladaptatus]
MEPTDAETACFEAGIKFGTLYHQFAGTPVSPESADSLARAMEEAILNQPHCEAVSVEIRKDDLAAAIDHGYTELTGKFMDVEMRIEYEGVTVHTRMAMEGGYPMMRVVDVA